MRAPVRVIDATTGKDVYVLRGSDSYAAGAAFVGPDRLASVSERDLRLWDVTADGPPELGAIAASSGRVWNVQTSPDGDELLVQTIEREVERLDAVTGEVLASRADLLVGEIGFRADVSPDWRYIGAIDATDGSAAVYDVATLAPTSDLPPCTSPTAFSPDGTMVVLDGRSMVCTPWLAAPPKFDPPPDADLRSRIIDVRSGTEILDLGPRRIFYAAFHPNGRYLAVNVENNAVEIYDIATRRLLTSFDVPDAIYKFEWDRAGRWLAGGTGGGRIWALDASAIIAGTPAADAFILDRQVQDGGIPDLTLSSDGTLVTVGFAGELRFWNIESGALLLELQTEPTDAPPAVQFAPDDRHLIYTDAGVIRRYPLDSDELITLADNVVTRSLTTEECRRYIAASDCS
jgi:WD40 repeat protein